MVHPGDAPGLGPVLGSLRPTRLVRHPPILPIPPVQGITLSESTLRIAPRSAVALADQVLLRAARTDPAPADRGVTSLVERLRRRLEPGPRRS
jgi:hypothetical protein